MAVAKKLAHGPRVAYAYMKETLNASLSKPFAEVLDIESKGHIHCGQTEDHVEAAKAFVEKRKPVFKGR